MTNLEALQAEVPAQIFDNDSVTFEKALIDVSLEQHNTYTVSNEDTIKEAAIKVIDMLLRRPDVSSEGTNIKVDRGYLKAERERLMRELGDNEAMIDGSSIW